MIAMTRPMMMCGHTAQGTTSDGEPVCAICFGRPEARQVDEAYTVPAPERRMRCSYAKRANELETHRGGGQYATRDFPSTQPSNPQGAFFKAQPDKPEDEFYCGCWGWD